jgi:hypothetical protein
MTHKIFQASLLLCIEFLLRHCHRGSRSIVRIEIGISKEMQVLGLPLCKFAVPRTRYEKVTYTHSRLKAIILEISNENKLRLDL